MLRKPVSIIILSLLLVSVLALAFNVQPVKSDYTWTQTIYINADGSISPLTAPISSIDNVTYTLTDSIVGNIPNYSSAIIVERDNITIDGAGFTLLGTYADWSTGIEMTGRSSVTIKNMKIAAFGYGIWLESSANSSIVGNSIMANKWDGIYLGGSGNSVSGNNITNNGDGVALYSFCSNSSLSGNNITNNGIGIVGSLYASSSISGNNITNNQVAIMLGGSNTDVSGNNITANRRGILLESSYNDSITGNNIIATSFDAIHLASSSSKNNSISGNNITANGEAIANEGSNNTIYHNDFINNGWQVFTIGSINVWDDGYPSGGNYWSNYAGLDLKGSPHQDQTGSDGIGDTPYVIDDYNRDNYPLISPYPMKPHPWAAHDVGITSVANSKSVVGQGCSASTNVIVFNYGNGTEAVNVAIYANQTALGEIYNFNVTGGNFALAAFIWNTTGLANGNYTISAYAEPIPGEADTSDNNFTGGWVFVSIVGDLTGGTSNPWDFVPDGKVDGKDIAIVALCFGSAPGCPPPYRWNANCDINNDAKIDGADIATVALHYGQADP